MGKLVQNVFGRYIVCPLIMLVNGVGESLVKFIMQRSMKSGKAGETEFLDGSGHSRSGNPRSFCQLHYGAKAGHWIVGN